MSVDFAALVRGTWSGSTILRTLEEAALRQHGILSGTTLDLGGADSGFVSQLRRDAGVRAFVVDVRPEAKPHVVANFESGLPFQTGSIRTVLLHNVLEHVYDYRSLLTEIERVLAPSGCLLLSVPFLMPEHELIGGYGDYHRFSRPALERLLHGFSQVTLIALETGPFTAAVHVMTPALPIRPLRTLLVMVSALFDGAYARLRRRRDTRTRIAFVLGYVGVARR
jgi:SAM-dependent methyltransferase